MKRLSLFLSLALAILLGGEANAYYDDVHYALTYYVARRTGYTHLQAWRIASADSQVDWDPDTEPVQKAGQAMLFLSPFEARAQGARWKFHAMRNELEFNNSVGNAPQAAEADNGILVQRNALWEQAVKVTRNPGVFLHSFQDEAPHHGYGTRWGHWPIAPGEIEPYLSQRIAVGGTTDWISYRPIDVELLCASTAKYLRMFMRAECPSQSPIDYADSAYTMLLARLAAVNPHPGPLDSDFKRRLYVAYYAKKLGLATTDLGDPDIESLSAQLGMGNRTEDYEKQRVGPKVSLAIAEVNKALRAAGFKEELTETAVHYDLDSDGVPEEASLDSWMLSGSLTTSFKSSRQILVSMRMPAMGPIKEYELGKPVSLQSGELHTWKDLPVGDLLMVVQAGPTQKRYEIKMTGRQNSLPEIIVDEDAPKTAPGNGQIWTCQRPRTFGKTVWGYMDEDKMMPPFSGGPSGATFNDPEGKVSGSTSWSGPPLVIREGQTINIKIAVSKMAASFSAVDVVDGGKKSIHPGAKDPFTPPHSTVDYSFVFAPNPKRNKVVMTMEATPMLSMAYNSCGVAVAWEFIRGGAPPPKSDQKPSPLSLVATVEPFKAEFWPRRAPSDDSIQDPPTRPKVPGVDPRPGTGDADPFGLTSGSTVEIPGPKDKPSDLSKELTEWSPSEVGTVKFADGQLTMAMAEGAGGEAKTYQKSPLKGDFDVTISYSLDDWTPSKDAILRWDVTLSDAPNQDSQQTVLITRAASPGFESLMVLPKGGGQPESKNVSGKAGGLRIVRKGDKCAVYTKEGNAWQELSTFGGQLPESLYLGFGLGQRGETRSAKVTVKAKRT